MKTKRILGRIILAYLIYVLVCGVLIFKIPYIKSSTINHDITKLKSPADHDTYALLVEDVETALAMRIAMIQEAEKSIDIAYYSIASGTAADIFYGALLTKANEGIKIRIIVDGITSFGHFKKDFQTVAIHPNIEYALYEEVNPLLIYSAHNSLHDKLLIIDDRYGLIGGRNISDRFLLESYPKQLTYDRDVLLIAESNTNSVVRQMNNYYEELFNLKYNRIIRPRNKRKFKKEELRLINTYKTYTKSMDNFDEYFEKQLEKKIKVKNAIFVSNTLNRFNKEPIILKTINKLSEGYEDIFIQTPYITPSRMVKKNLILPANANITILSNNLTTNPNLVASSGYIRIRKKLAKATTLYEFQDKNSIHAKTITLGKDISIIGSMNLDHRSAFLSTESMVFIYSEDFYKSLKNEIDTLLETSLIVQKDGSYLSDETVEEIKKDKTKILTIRILSLISALFNEML